MNGGPIAVVASAMSRQNPLKIIISQLLHGFDLLGPGVPTEISESNQVLLVG